MYWKLLVSRRFVTGAAAAHNNLKNNDVDDGGDGDGDDNGDRQPVIHIYDESANIYILCLPQKCSGSPILMRGVARIHHHNFNYDHKKIENRRHTNMRDTTHNGARCRAHTQKNGSQQNTSSRSMERTHLLKFFNQSRENNGIPAHSGSIRYTHKFSYMSPTITFNFIFGIFLAPLLVFSTARRRLISILL